MIEQIEQLHNSQDEVDNLYAELCDIYYHEMNVWFKCKNIHPCARKRLHRILKPFWNSDLQNLWNELRKAENKFCKSTG